MKTKKIFFASLIGIFSFVSCSDINEPINVLKSSQLKVSTSLERKSETRAIVTGTDLGAGQKIGISIFDQTTGGDYYSKNSGYINVPYSSQMATDGKTILWSSITPIVLGPVDGKAVAYYPYTSGVNIEAIPLSVELFQDENNQVDYMYSDWVDRLNSTNNHGIFNMNHALCGIKISIINDSYTGIGAISKVGVTSQGLATQGKLNAKTGTITGLVGQGSEIASKKSFTISKNAHFTTLLAVPLNSNNKFDVKIDMDNKTYHVPVTLQENIVSGNIYHLKITAKDKTNSFDLMSVKVKPWVEKNVGDYIIE